LAGWFAFRAAIRTDGIRYERSLRDNDLLQWSKTEERLIDRIVKQDEEIRELQRTTYVEREKLMSIIVTMREQGYGGGHLEQFEEPETYQMTNADELAEYQRRIGMSEGTDEELTGLVRSKLAEELGVVDEFEEPEPY
jgi:hypothetical protein